MTYQANIIKLSDLVGKTEGLVFLIIGPPGVGKEAFAIRFLTDGLKNKETAIMLGTDTFPHEIIGKMKELGTDADPYIRNQQLFFIDAFSYRMGQSVEDNELAVDNIRDLTGLSLLIKKLADGNGKARLVLNAISTISIYNSGVALLDFTQTQVARLKQAGNSAIILAHHGIIEEKVLQGLKASVDGVIQFKAEEDQSGIVQRKIRVEYAPTIKQSGWVNLYR
jgi:KaiC/GvpD/RAD55 family RecA-like ATPase